jgi:hypothetical protein
MVYLSEGALGVCGSDGFSERRGMHAQGPRQANKMAELAGLAPSGNNLETGDSVEPQEQQLSACFSGSRVGIEIGRNLLIVLWTRNPESQWYPISTPERMAAANIRVPDS